MEVTRVVRDERGLITHAVKEQVPSFVDDETGDEYALDGLRFLVSRGAVTDEGPIRTTHSGAFESLGEVEAHCRELEGKAVANGESVPNLTICAIPPDVQLDVQGPAPATVGAKLRAVEPTPGFGFQGRS